MYFIKKEIGNVNIHDCKNQGDSNIVRSMLGFIDKIKMTNPITIIIYAF